MKNVILFFAALIISCSAAAQLSPFVGSYAIVVKIKDNNLPADAKLVLREIRYGKNVQKCMHNRPGSWLRATMQLY
jgi:hypothetical protein